jgi:hypothetical protein
MKVLFFWLLALNALAGIELFRSENEGLASGQIVLAFGITGLAIITDIGFLLFLLIGWLF